MLLYSQCNQHVNSLRPSDAICVSKLTIIDSDNGLSPERRQAIIRTKAGTLVIWPLGTNFSEIWSKIIHFNSSKRQLKMSSGKWRSFCLGLNVLIDALWSCCPFYAWTFFLKVLAVAKPKYCPITPFDPNHDHATPYLERFRNVNISFYNFRK